MAVRVSVADFVTKVNEEQWAQSDTFCEALDRFTTPEEKDLKTRFRMQGADKASIRKEMLFSIACSRRVTQTGIVPLSEIRTRARLPSAVKKMITKWLLDLLNDVDTGKAVEEKLKKKLNDVFFSADKLSRICQRLEDEDDLIHDTNNSVNAILAACNSINSTIVNEGKCEIVRATEDAIIAKFDPIPEHLLIGQQRKTFYKCFPVDSKKPMIHGVTAMSAISNREFIMNHGHGHLRTVPYHEIENAVTSFSKKSKEEIRRIKADIQTPTAGERFKVMVEMIESGNTIKEITQRIQQFYRKDKPKKNQNENQDD